MNAIASSLQSSAAQGTDLDLLDDPVEQQRFTRWKESPAGEREAESFLQLSGMYCAACAGVIEAALEAVDGVKEARVSAASQRALVRWDPSRTKPSLFVKAVRAAGYDAVPDAAASTRELRIKERRQALWRLFVASFCAMQIMMFATPTYVAKGNELAMDLRQLLNWASWLVSLPVLLFSAGPFFRGAWYALKRRTINMDVPVALGVLVTFIASSGATFDPFGPFGHEVYFDSLTMFVSFLLTGRFLEMSARHRAAQNLEDAVSGMPESALRIKAGTEEVETVSVLRLRPGDHVRVPLGAAIPADGRLLLGAAQVDESLLTGESRPVEKQIGDELVAGSLNLAAPLTMSVDRVGADTRHEAIVAMMRDAMSQRPALARWADQWARPFLWVVLLLAAGAAAGWSLVDPSKAVWVAVSVLIVTCPCALSLAAPSALVAVAGALARRGVMVQRLDALESLARMTQLFTDKTGTLTEDRPQLVHCERSSGSALTLEQLRTKAKSLAQWSSHPLSRALVDACTDESSAGDVAAWLDVYEEPGEGLRAVDAEGVEWRLGRLAWIESGRSHSGQVPRGPAGETQDDWPPAGDGRMLLFFGRAGHCELRFEFDEVLRPDASVAIAALAADGVRVCLLSGDVSARVHAVGRLLSLYEVQGGLSPEGKLAAVARAQAEGEIVGMLGDGVNDAPVLARANVSLAMGQGALVSRVHADAVISSNRLIDLIDARHRARHAMRVVRQNLIWAAVYNGACIPLALLGYLPPWAAGMGMAASSLLVVGNSWRLSR